MNWLDRFFISRAASRYARRLPPVLGREWGVSKTYTPGQIVAGVKTARLNPKYIALAYATYLTEKIYAELKPGLPLILAYGGARTIFKQRIPWGPGHPWENPKGSDGIGYGSDWPSSGGHSGHGGH